MASPVPAVDAHAHVFSATAPAVTGARYRPDYGADASDWRELWKHSGVTHGVVVQPSFFGLDNREMLDTVASDPVHLRGVAVLDPLLADDGVIERFNSQGVRAMRLNLHGVEDYRPYGTKRWRELYRRAADTGWHVEVFVDLGRLPEIEHAFDGTPITVAFDHFGSTGAEPRSSAASFAAIERMAREREVYVKFSAPFRFASGHPREVAARWLDAVGPARVLWGSDWPWTGHEAGRDYERLRAELDDWVDPRVARAALWDNAARLYGFA